MSSDSAFDTFSDEERSPSRGSSGSFASEDEYLGTADYRRCNLSVAAIFINELQETQCPPRIRSFTDFLIRGLDVEAIGAVDVEASTSLLSNPLRDTAAALASQVENYRFHNEPEWMDFHEGVFAAFAHPLIDSCFRQTFDVEVGPSSDPKWYLSPPTPKLAFGLASPDWRHRDRSSCLDHSFLFSIRKRGIQAYPFRGREFIKPAFPCVLSEVVTNFSTLMTAENRAAHSAAKALAMMQTLRESYYHTVGAHLSAPLPVVVICSQGAIYEVFIAFDLQREEVPVRTDPYAGYGDGPYPHSGVNLVRIWLGAVDSTKMGYQLQLLLQRILHWILEVYRPTIMSMLETIKATMPHSTDPEYA